VSSLQRTTDRVCCGPLNIVIRRYAAIGFWVSELPEAVVKKKIFKTTDFEKMSAFFKFAMLEGLAFWISLSYLVFNLTSLLKIVSKL